MRQPHSPPTDRCHWKKSCPEPVESIVTIRMLSVGGPAVLEYNCCRVHARDAVDTATAAGKAATARTIVNETT